ncbi:MAG: hypothetical protein KY475_04285 [Planctomycetes bacterium]|nr:hypothetical protein [Planctomycetota bacterium]
MSQSSPSTGPKPGPRRTSRGKPPANLAVEAAKIIGGGVLGIVIALAILKYGMKVSWLNESIDDNGPPVAIQDRSRSSESSQTASSRPRRKHDAPSPEKQAEIRADIDAIFAKQLSGQLSDEQKSEVALRLAQLADEAEDSPEERFVLLRKAAELAVEAGDLDRMTALVQEMAGEFDFDPLAARAAFLKQFAGEADEAEELDSLVLHAKLTIDDARAMDRYELAVALAEATRVACRRPEGAKHREYVEEGCERLAITARRWKEYQDARKTLETTPEDPAANLTAGRWLCLEKGQWKQGLASLAQAGNHPLAEAARRDRAVAALPVESPAQMVEVADQWFDAALADEEDHGFLGRAHFWYTRAQPLLSGEQATHVENRLDNIFAYPAARHVLGM